MDEPSIYWYGLTDPNDIEKYKKRLFKTLLDDPLISSIYYDDLEINTGSSNSFGLPGADAFNIQRPPQVVGETPRDVIKKVFETQADKHVKEQERLRAESVKQQEKLDTQWNKLIPEIAIEYSKSHAAGSNSKSANEQCRADALKDVRRLNRLLEEYTYTVDASDSNADGTVKDRTKELLEIINLADVIREHAEQNNNLLGLNGGQVFFTLFNKECLPKLFYRYSRVINELCNKIYLLTDNHLQSLSLGKRCKNFFTSGFRNRKQVIQHIESLKKQLDLLYGKMEELVEMSQEAGMNEAFRFKLENGSQTLEETQQAIDNAYSHFNYYRDKNS